MKNEKNSDRRAQRRRSSGKSLDANRRLTWFTTALEWVEDHATALIASLVTVWFGAILTLLLWKTAQVISLAKEYGPILAVVAATTTIALGVLGLLKDRRRRRLRAARRSNRLMASRRHRVKRARLLRKQSQITAKMEPPDRHA
ncbi:hypothetical protein HerbRD11066_32230 [Herbidospora sp. RD11066]